MPAPAAEFAYAIVRVVPRVERGERFNAGVVLFCRRRGFLGARVALDRRRLAALAPGIDPETVSEPLRAIERVAAGDPAGGAVAALPASERFGFLVAPASTIVQPSPVHTGLCADPAAELERLFATLVGPPAGPRLRPATLYAHARGAVLVPLTAPGLPAEADALGQRWAAKAELHVTAVSTRHVAALVGDEDRAWAAIAATVARRDVGDVTLTGELRAVAEGAERALVAMAEVEGLAALYEDLSRRLGAEIQPPPAHVTLCTRPGGAAIGLHDAAELARLSRPLTAAEAAEVRAALRLDAVLGGVVTAGRG